ncbi:hypothetical protein CLV58_12546 [Spirosoma oryzae]|uniref:DUF1643 domain-containing protein n=1 Tax=Spirosoma oryzae TaxID=1469603 RepID=A0A2T0S8M4_9BACT|nr:DUF1643 domain-containing protein [Spirosoma oryzae]PRY29784.1 hypothetical protein CLV58_12546 [Spirosoma oryzae]
MIIQKQALVSECGTYRYHLSRSWGNNSGRSVLFVMLNPSTADASIDDPTIRRCIRFAQDWGYDSMSVVNLFALRSTDPGQLKKHDNPIGEENEDWIKFFFYNTDTVVFAWGAHGKLNDRDKQVIAIAEHCNVTPYCFSKTKDGQPKHPLYIAASTQLIKF